MAISKVTDWGMKSTMAYRMGRLWHRVAHGKCAEVDSRVDIRGGYSQLRHSVHIPCFSLNSASDKFLHLGGPPEEKDCERGRWRVPSRKFDLYSVYGRRGFEEY